MDFDLPLRREQWEEIGHCAAALEQEDGDFEWSDDRDRIVVYLRDQEAQGLWRDLTSEPETYGSPRPQIAEFVFNDGPPYEHPNGPPTAKPAAILPQESSPRL